MGFFSFGKQEDVLPACLKGREEWRTYRILRFSGLISLTGVIELEESIDRDKKRKSFECKHLVLDFADVSQMDASTLALLVKGMVDYKTPAQKIVIINLKPELQGLLTAAKVEKMVQISPNEAEAIKATESA